jgi:lipopolysaccharide export system permease protein
MKKLLFRKFLKDNLKLFTAIILSIGSIVWVIQSVGFLDIVTEDGHSFKVYFFYSLLNFPKIIHRILPFVFFITLFYQITKYENNNELLVFWIHGVKKIQLINIVIIYSIFLGLFQFILGGYISPIGQDKARSFIRGSNLDFFPSIIREGKFVDTVENLTIFIEKKNENGDFENIFLKDDTEGSFGNKSQIIFAKRAKLINDENNRYFKLFNGKLIKTQNNKIDVFEFKSIDFSLLKFATKSTTFPKVQEVNINILLKCLIYEAENKLNKFKYMTILGCNSNAVKNIKQEIFKRLYMPIYIPLIALMTCLLILRSKEDKTYRSLKFLIFFIIFFIIIISETSLRYSTVNNFGFLFFVFFPLLVFCSIYLNLIINFRNKI